MKNKVYLIDVTNRDGVQTSRILLPKLSKTMLNLYSDEMGIFQSEIGFPTLKHEVNYINANLELVKVGAIKRLRLEGWCRNSRSKCRRCIENRTREVDRIHHCRKRSRGGPFQILRHPWHR